MRGGNKRYPGLLRGPAHLGSFRHLGKSDNDTDRNLSAMVLWGQPRCPRSSKSCGGRGQGGQCPQAAELGDASKFNPLLASGNLTRERLCIWPNLPPSWTIRTAVVAQGTVHPGSEREIGLLGSVLGVASTSLCVLVGAVILFWASVYPAPLSGVETISVTQPPPPRPALYCGLKMRPQR